MEIEAENFNMLIQLLASIEDGVKEIEKAMSREDNERMKEVKAEILNFQKKISEIIS